MIVVGSVGAGAGVGVGAISGVAVCVVGGATADVFVSEGGGVASLLAVTSVLILSIFKFPMCEMSVPVPMAENATRIPMNSCWIFCICQLYHF